MFMFILSIHSVEPIKRPKRWVCFKIRYKYELNYATKINILVKLFSSKHYFILSVIYYQLYVLFKIV